jgi:hypothetical protein
MMNWKGFGRKQSWPNFKVLSLKGARKTTKNLSKASPSMGQDLNSGPPKY